jgi:hypothetical protein
MLITAAPILLNDKAMTKNSYGNVIHRCHRML